MRSCPRGSNRVPLLQARATPPQSGFWHICHGDFQCLLLKATKPIRLSSSVSLTGPSRVMCPSSSPFRVTSPAPQPLHRAAGLKCLGSVQWQGMLQIPPNDPPPHCPFQGTTSSGRLDMCLQTPADCVSSSTFLPLPFYGNESSKCSGKILCRHGAHTPGGSQRSVFTNHRTNQRPHWFPPSAEGHQPRRSTSMKTQDSMHQNSLTSDLSRLSATPSPHSRICPAHMFLGNS